MRWERGLMALAVGAVVGFAMTVSACGGGSGGATPSTGRPASNSTGLASGAAKATTSASLVTPSLTGSLTQYPQVSPEQALAAVNSAIQKAGLTLDVKYASRLYDCLGKNILPLSDKTTFSRFLNGCLSAGPILAGAVQSAPEIGSDLETLVDYTYGIVDRAYDQGFLDSRDRAESIKGLLRQAILLGETETPPPFLGETETPSP